MSSVTIDLYFGYPGSGKSTFAAYLARRAFKHGIPVYSNFPIVGAYEIDPFQDLGSFQVSDCLLLWDEAGIDANNRSFKTFPKKVIKFLKLHRHYNVQIAVFSQAYNDVDITIRRLAHTVYWVRPSMFPYFITVSPITKTCDIYEGQIIDSYVIHDFPVIFKKFVFCPPCWKLFDSYACETLPDKEWSMYNSSVSSPSLVERSEPEAPEGVQGEGVQPNENEVVPTPEQAEPQPPAAVIQKPLLVL